MSSLSISRILAILVLGLAISKLHAEEDDDFCNRWTISADFLAWYPSEEVSSIWADVITVGSNTSSWGAPGFDLKWGYGSRIGVGYHLSYDEWDTVLYWTWFRTQATRTIPSPPNLLRLDPEFFAAFLSGDLPKSMSAKWSLLFNMFDWELGRRYWVTECLSMRPFLGLKGGWIYQGIHAQYYDLTIGGTPTDNSATEHVKNNFWGIGPLGGINTQWRAYQGCSNSFDLCGDFSAAAMYGTWIYGDHYENTLSQTSSINTKNSTLGALMFRGFLGLGWTANFRGKTFVAKLGYEMQIWLNQLRIATFQLQRLHGDLTLQGITLSCGVDF